MKVLALTSTSMFLSLSIINDSAENIFTYLELKIINNNQIMLIDKVINTIKNFVRIEDIERIFVTNGPGYFTTIRISCLIAQTISFILKKELTFIDNFKALKNIYNYFFNDLESIYAIKIASNRFKYDLLSQPVTLEELIKLSKKANKKIVFYDMNYQQIEKLKSNQTNYQDLSDIFNSSIIYLTSKNDLQVSYDYNIKIVY